MLTIPTRKLIIHEIINEKVPILREFSLISNNEKTSEPIIIGILNKKENVVTSDLFPFKINPVRKA